MTQHGNQIRPCECYIHTERRECTDSFLRRFNLKNKRRKVAEEDELQESVRTISALFSSAGSGIAPASTEFDSSDQPLDARVASISAEIAAAIAQAQSRAYEDDEDEESGSGQEMSVLETIGPNTSGIRGDDFKQATRLIEREFEDDDSDAFPVPLRTRKAKACGVGIKRKR